jgi:hypothetical protein
VTPWMFYYWRERLPNEERPKARRTRRSSSRVQLAPVHVVSGAEGRGGDVEILLAQGDRIRVAASVSMDTLRRVVAGLADVVLAISSAVRIYLATGATDLRRSIDGLAALVRERFALDPLSGHLFRRRSRAHKDDGIKRHTAEPTRAAGTSFANRDDGPG